MLPKTVPGQILVLRSSINWPSNLVTNVFRECLLLLHNVKEIFLVLGGKEQYIYIETQL